MNNKIFTVENYLECHRDLLKKIDIELTWIPSNGNAFGSTI